MTRNPVTIPSDGQTGKGLILGFLGVAAFSLTLPMTRIAVTGLDPSAVAIWRAVIAGLAALLVLAVLRPARPRGRQWALLAACAFGTVFGFPWFMSLAMLTVSASHGAVVVALLPIATAVVGVLIGHERPSIGFWLASLFGTVVTLAFVFRQTEGGLEFGHVYLLLAVVAAGVGYGYGGLLSREIPGWVVACWSLVASLPLLTLITFLIPTPNWHQEAVVLGAVAYLALVSQFGAFFLWYRAMALAGITRASQVQLLQVFLTIVFAALMLGEAWDAEVFVFGALVAATVWMTMKQRVRRK